MPLELPEVDNFLPTKNGDSPLGNSKKWAWDLKNKTVVENNLINDRDIFPLELNTMPGWAGSSWYFYRYMDPANNAPKAAYLCTEAAGNITGQVIGTNGWPLDLYSPRHVIRSIHKNGRWTLKELEDLIPFTLSNGLINPVPPQKK